MAKPRGPARQHPEPARPSTLESQASASRRDEVRAPALKVPLQATASPATTLPAALRTLASRTDGSDSEALLPNLKLRRTLELAPANRSADAPAQEVLGVGSGLLALEAADGLPGEPRRGELAIEMPARKAPVESRAVQGTTWTSPGHVGARRRTSGASVRQTLTRRPFSGW